MYDKRAKISLGGLAHDLHERPSTLVGWTSSEDWYERYIFDKLVMIAYNDERAAQIKKMKKW